MSRIRNFGLFLNKQDLQNYDKSSTHGNAMGDVTLWWMGTLSTRMLSTKKDQKFKTI